MEEKADKKKVRNSNLELYRIIVMLLIVAHHYVVNSGLSQILTTGPLNFTSSVMLLFGAWGKTGINCFVLITGYFMYQTQISGEKLLKLYLQILFYTLIIYGIFCLTGHERFSFSNLLWKTWPVKSIADGFTSCFILFYLFIPFLNKFIKVLEKEQYRYLLLLLVVTFSVLPTVPVIRMSFNYVGWFMVIYLVGAYIRKYGFLRRISHSTWGWIALGLVMIGSMSVIGIDMTYKLGYLPLTAPYFFIADCNKVLSLAIAVSSFMYFKDLRIPHSRLINAIGGTTFGVLLIHANSEAMRTWLWKETVDCIGHFGDSILLTLGYASLTVVLVFIVCSGIDWFRGRLIEPQLVNYTKVIISMIKCRGLKTQ